MATYPLSATSDSQGAYLALDLELNLEQPLEKRYLFRKLRRGLSGLLFLRMSLQPGWVAYKTPEGQGNAAAILLLLSLRVAQKR